MSKTKESYPLFKRFWKHIENLSYKGKGKSTLLLVLISLIILLFIHRLQAEPINTYIPSLSATVTALNFYESPDEGVPYNQREYKNAFSKSSSRFISWELNLEYPKPNRRINFEIIAIYYRPDGSKLGQQTKKAHIKSNWTNSYHNWGRGWKKAGNWKVGAYRVDLFIKGQKVASGTFEIVSTESEPLKPIVPHEKEKPFEDIEIPDDLGEL